MAYAKGKGHSKDTGENPMDIVLRSFISQAMKKLADSFHEICSFLLLAEILSHANMCRYYNWMAGLANSGIFVKFFVFFSSSCILREAPLHSAFGQLGKSLKSLEVSESPAYSVSLEFPLWPRLAQP